RQFLLSLRCLAHRSQHQSQVPVLKIAGSPRQLRIRPAPRQALSLVLVRAQHPLPQHRQVGNPPVRRRRNKSRPELQLLKNRQHDFLRMNPTEIPLKSPASVTDLSVGDVEQVERALIDASTRVPVLMFYASAVVWLLLGTLLAAFTSFKLHSPDLLSNVSFLTWGRIRPAHLNVMLYG